MRASYKLKCGKCQEKFDGTRRQKLRVQRKMKVFCSIKCKQNHLAARAGESHLKRYLIRLNLKHEMSK